MKTTELIKTKAQLVEEIVSVLTPDEQQLLKDTINHGRWGDADYEFLTKENEIETVSMIGYCTNDAKNAGNFNGRKVSTMFRVIYMKLCPKHHNQIGRYISHCNDWWGDGRGDMLFIRYTLSDAFEEWARQTKEQPLPVIERIKTFADAAREVGIDDPEEWEENYSNLESDVLAYFKLRIIVQALNEGWKPQFTKNEWRYYPWFWLYTEHDIEDIDEDEKNDRRMMNTGDYVTDYAGFASADSNSAPSYTSAGIGSRLCLKTPELATYCGKQFIKIWADFYLIHKDED